MKAPVRSLIFTLVSCLLGYAYVSTAQSPSRAKTSPAPFVRYNHPQLGYEGRIQYQPGAAVLHWPGTSVTIRFEGTGVSAVLKDQDTANYYQVIVDNRVISKIHTDTTKRRYALASRLKPGTHTLQLFKRTEWDKGKTWFYGFQLEKGSRLLPPAPPKKRKVEFYGNSITCGYGMEDRTGQDRGTGYFENNYLSYAALTARHFDARYSCIGKSGIGVLVSWFPLTMPEMYDRLDPTDSSSKWDFSRYTPDLVVINLFQNDSWLVKQKEHEQFKARFGTTPPDAASIVQAYRNFVQNIRSKYPRASIICALGNMDATREGSPWPGYIRDAVSGLNDKKIYTHFFPYKDTPGHPKVEEQKAMADDLIGFIEKNIRW